MFDDLHLPASIRSFRAEKVTGFVKALLDCEEAEARRLLASTKAMRLKPRVIDVRVEVGPIHYFLGGPEDVRSTFYLEECAMEFQVQGLGLDWTCVTWDADRRRDREDWSFHDLRGSRWQGIHSEENRRNLKNAYRVLLKRARQGMVIFVPPGSAEDPTRLPVSYDQ